MYNKITHENGTMLGKYYKSWHEELLDGLIYGIIFIVIGLVAMPLLLLRLIINRKDFADDFIIAFDFFLNGLGGLIKTPYFVLRAFWLEYFT